jgi:hypothetical protein
MLNGAGMMHGGCIAYLIDKFVGPHFKKFQIILRGYDISAAAVHLLWSWD